MALIANLHSVIRTKKKHPCGSDLWEVVRTGADYKLKCLQCGRVVLLSSEALRARMKEVVEEKHE